LTFFVSPEAAVFDDLKIFGYPASLFPKLDFPTPEAPNNITEYLFELSISVFMALFIIYYFFKLISVFYIIN
jgi:hypothetical protein